MAIRPFSRTLNIAHRGARSLAPENTLAAARKAFEIGADLWELDVCMTSDGELILLHDDTLERTSNAAEVFPTRKPWRVCDFTFEEIRQLDFGTWFNLTDPFGQIASGHAGLQDRLKFTGATAPTLREALEFTRDLAWKVNVEIKDLSGTSGHPVVVEKVVGLIRELGMEGDVMISSFQHEYLQQVKTISPGIKTGALVEQPDPDPVSLINRLKADAYNPDAAAITPEDIVKLRREGIEVYIYTVNAPNEMIRLVNAHASGIFTDYPQTLKQILASL